MKYTPCIIDHFTRALKWEINTLENVQEIVGEEWPPWFDANDLSIYDTMLNRLEDVDSGNPREVNIRSKPYSFMMEVVSRYVNANIREITEKDRLEIFTFWEDYTNEISSEST